MSAGLVHSAEPGLEVLAREAPEQGVYKKIVVKDGLLVGAIWMGTRKGQAEIGRLVALQRRVGPRREDLLEDTFDWSGV
jgi:NAD(P)H-nitrite reductase large subunit